MSSYYDTNKATSANSRYFILNGTEEQHFLDRTMSAREQQLIFAADDPCTAFTELWTRKEALAKAIGTGLNIEQLPTMLEHTESYQLISCHTPQYAYALARKFEA